MGLFFRTEDWGRLYYTRLDVSLQPLADPVIVDRVEQVDGPGFQPRAVAVPGGRVLFLALRVIDGSNGDANYCFALRVMNEDGSRPHDAPWQLPCLDPSQPWKTWSMDLMPVPGGAVLVWTQRSKTGYVQPGDDYEEGIYAVLLTPEGKRGSEVIEVTDADATALPDFVEPATLDWTIGSAGEGNDFAVAWSPDTRPSAPGMYVRRFRCQVGE